MKCKTIERWMLREEQPNSRTADLRAGEMFGWRARRIQAHLAGCESCRRWLEDYRKIGEITEAVLPRGEPSEKVLTNIRREARIRAPEPHTHAGWRGLPFVVRSSAVRLFVLRPVRPSLSLATIAAACLVLVGAWWMKPDPNGFGSAAQISTIMLMLSEDTASLDAETTALGEDLEQVASLDALAQQLLTLQGLDAEYTEAELSTPVEELPATDPLARNTSAFQSGIYG